MTIEKIDEIWNGFKQRADRAEQYQFPQILMWQLKLEPLYDDLHKNWDSNHAEIFVKMVKFMYRNLGWEVDEVGQDNNQTSCENG